MAEHPSGPPELGGSPSACSHSWLLVTCGDCGAALDELGKGRAAPTGEAGGGIVEQVQPSGGQDTEALFIVARGHPELIAQLRALMGDSGSIRVIEDRRSTSRDPASPQGHEVSIVRAEFRRRILESDSSETR